MPGRLSRLAVLALMVWAPLLMAGEFTINPLRVSLDRTARASEVTVRNDDATPLRMQVQAMSWRQDAEGKDQYEVSDDLIFFPRALEIPPGESRIIRVGVKAAPATREDTYRLFIEELPPAVAPTPEAGRHLAQGFPAGRRRRFRRPGASRKESGDHATGRSWRRGAMDGCQPGQRVLPNRPR